MKDVSCRYLKTIGKERQTEKLEFKKLKLWNWNDSEEIKNEKAIAYLISKLLDLKDMLHGQPLIYTLIKI